MNPVSALTGATGDRMLDDPLVRDFCSAAMLEARRSARASAARSTRLPRRAMP
jgi:2-dehydropantoate 2-reductase